MNRCKAAQERRRQIQVIKQIDIVISEALFRWSCYESIKAKLADCFFLSIAKSFAEVFRSCDINLKK